MPDPQRLVETSNAARRLVAASQEDCAPAAVRSRVLVNLGFAAGTTAVAWTVAGGASAASSASASSSALGASSVGTAAQSGVFAKLSMLAAKGTVLKTMGGAVLIGGTMYGAANAVPEETTAHPDERPQVVSGAANVTAGPHREARVETPLPVELPAAPEPNATALKITDLPLAPSESKAVPPRSVAIRSRAVATTNDETSSLQDELGLIHRAREELSRGNQTAAGITLREYEKRFPDGKLRPEADTLRGRLGW